MTSYEAPDTCKKCKTTNHNVLTRFEGEFLCDRCLRIMKRKRQNERIAFEKEMFIDER